MHELLLFGQVPATRHAQLLSILAGLCAMQPQHTTEHHVLFRPTTIPEVTGPAKGGSQGVPAAQKSAAVQVKEGRNSNTDVFYVRLVRDVVVAVEGDERKAEEEGLEMEEDESERWRFVFQETPVPGKRPTLLRMAQETNITGGDPQEWVEALGYTYAVPLSPLSFPPLPYYESR